MRLKTGGNVWIAPLVVGLLIVPLFMPTTALPGNPTPEQIETSTVSDPSRWLPPAWETGDLSALSLEEMILVLAGAEPDGLAHEDVLAALDRLERLPPVYTEVANVVLGGMTRAYWHQELAMIDLEMWERELVRSADPDAPASPELSAAVARLDRGQILLAAAVMVETSERVLAILEAEERRDHGVAAAMAEAFGMDVRHRQSAVWVPPPVDIGTVADLFLVFSSQLDPDTMDTASEPGDLEGLLEATEAVMDPVALAQERAVIEAMLEGAPQHGLGAMAHLLQALLPFAAGVPPEPERHLMELGYAMDEARPTLEIWAAAALAKQVVTPERFPTRIPDPDALVPELRMGMPILRQGGLPSDPPPLEEAVRVLAMYYGDDETARNASGLVDPIKDVLPERQVDAVSRMLEAIHSYLLAVDRLEDTPMPRDVDPRAIHGSVSAFQEGSLPEPGSPVAAQLLQAQDHLQAVRDSQAALDAVLEAAEDLVEEFAQPSQASQPMGASGMSAPSSTNPLPCINPQVVISFILAIDPCGVDSHWTGEHILLIDVGGDDVFERRGGAPFDGGQSGQTVENIPVAMTFAFGGNNEYNATGQDCAQGAACGRNAVALLVDWKGDDTTAKNVFVAGDKSQGYGGGESNSAIGLLVERVGENSTLESVYTAGDHSQGSANPDVSAGTTIEKPEFYQVMMGRWMRLTGSDSQSLATVMAGNFSQGSGGSVRWTSTGTFLNLHGTNTSSESIFSAGTDSQGSAEGDSIVHVPYGLFGNLAGPGSLRNDTYYAENRSRGHLISSGVGEDQAATGFIAFLSGVVPGTWDVEVSENLTMAMEASADGPHQVQNHYSGPIHKGAGYGCGSSQVRGSFFLDFGGTNTYSFDEEESWPENHKWHEENRPRDGGSWTVEGEEVLCGRDVNTQDEDGDGVPSFVEVLWNDFVGLWREVGISGEDDDEEDGILQEACIGEDLFLPFLPCVDDELEEVWSDDTPAPSPSDVSLSELANPWWPADPEDRRSSPLPSHPSVLIDPVGIDLQVDRPFGVVFSVGGNDGFGADFSSAVTINLAGDDVYFGRTGAAAMGTLPFKTDDPFAQNLLSFHLDLQGDDTYETDLLGSLGFGAGGAVGLLFDLGGDDKYIAPNWTQGVGVNRGLGVLLDLGVPGHLEHWPDQPDHGGALDEVDEELDGAHPSSPRVCEQAAVVAQCEKNLFRVALWANETHGYSEGGGGGFLVATGARNTFQNGTQMGSGENTGSGQVNMGENQPPVIHDFRVLGSVDGEWVEHTGDLLAGETYRFEARVFDLDGDDLKACWTFREGVQHQGTPGPAPGESRCRMIEGNLSSPAEHEPWEEFTWTDVPTDGTLPTPYHNLSYLAGFTVSDPGGDSGSAGLVVNVSNPPPRFIEPVELIGPPAVQVGEWGAYFAAVNLSSFAISNLLTVVDWGDQSPRTVADWPPLMDWARDIHGAEARVPGCVVVPVAGVEDPGCTSLTLFENSLPLHAIDGDNETAVTFGFNPEGSAKAGRATAHLSVVFPEARPLVQIQMDAEMDEKTMAPFELSVEVVLDDGTLVPLGVLDPTDEIGLDLPETLMVERIVLRQLTTDEDYACFHDSQDPCRDRIMHLRAVRALGVGVEHQWSTPGLFEMSYSLANDYGARNTTTMDIQVVGVEDSDGALELPPVPYRLDRIAGRSGMHHVSVASGDAHNISFEPVPGFFPGFASGWVCVDWGEGAGWSHCWEPSKVNRTTFSHTWNEPESYEVVMGFWGSEQDFQENQPPITNETMGIVHVEEAFDLRVRMDDDDDDEQESEDWNPILWLGLDQSQNQANRTTWHAPFDGSVHYLAIVDAVGDDRYIDRVAAPRDGFPSMVVDAGGDDAFLSNVPRTQGFGSMGAVGLLLSGGGNNLYVAPGRAQGAAETQGIGILLDLGGDDVYNPAPVNHQDVLAGRPDGIDPWTKPPESLRGLRAGLAPSEVDLVQGAANEGIGVLFSRGGDDLYSAGSRSQGFGSHEVQGTEEYVLPGPYCATGAPNEGGVIPALLNDDEDFQDRIASALEEASFFPWCLIGFNQGGRASEEWDPIRNPGCTWVDNQGNTAPCTPNTDKFSQFISSGSRYGPGIGIFWREGGSAVYQAEQSSQGSSTPSARGVFVDLAGGFMAGAHRDAQGFTSSGQSLFLAGSAHAAYLESSGQGFDQDGPRSPGAAPDLELLPGTHPEPVSEPVARYVGIEGDARCDDMDNCQRNMTMIESDDSVKVNWEKEPDPWMVTEDEVTVSVSVVEGEGEVDVWAGSFIHGSWDVGKQECNGPLVASPVVWGRANGSEQEEFEFTMDATKEFPDGPVTPAGCHRLYAFAREADGAWSRSSELSLLLLPPPKLELDPSGAPVKEPQEGGLSVVDLTADMSFQVPLLVREPLASAMDDPIELRVQVVKQDDGQSSETIVEFTPDDTTGAWNLVNGVARRVLDLQIPDTVQVPDGQHLILVEASWKGFGGGGESGMAELFVNFEPPELTVSQNGAWFGRTAGAMSLEGAADSAGGVEDVRIRLVEPDCDPGLDPHECVRSSVPPGEGPPSAPSSLDAELQGCTGASNLCAWNVLFRLPSSFPGGPLVVEANATGNNGKNQPWHQIGMVHIDLGRPEMTLTTATGSQATNEQFPLDFTLKVFDCANDEPTQQDCIAGPGVDEGSIIVLGRNRVTSEIHPLEMLSIEESGWVDGSGAPWGWDISVRWDQSDSDSDPGSPLPVPGTYEILAEVGDGAGNVIAYNPGMALIVDRTPPNILTGSLMVTLPEGQQAIKQEDDLTVQVRARDDGSGVASVEASLGSQSVSLEPDEEKGSDWYGGQLTVPDLGAGMHEVTVKVTDAAGNPTQTSSTSILFLTKTIDVDWTDVRRAHAITMDAIADRPVWVEDARLEKSQGGTAGSIPGIIAGDGTTQPRILFEGLDPDADYFAFVELRDAANNTLQRALDLRTEPTRELILAVDPPGTATRSDLVTIRGSVVPVDGSTVSLQVGDKESPSVDEVHLAFGGQQIPMTFPFELSFDSTVVLPESEQRALDEVDVFIVYDDGAVALDQRLTLRIDNAPPEVSPAVLGPEPRNGWYNRSVVVAANAVDDTPPLTIEASVDSQDAGSKGQTTLTKDGVYLVDFQVWDGALPPNQAEGDLLVRVDRTAPVLEAFVDMDVPATKEPVVPLNVSAKDDLSGLEGYRIRISNPWSPWTPDPPTEADLSGKDDGEHWIDVEARDIAGNTRRETMSVILDREAPELMVATWIGWSPDDDPILRIVAEDPAKGGVAASGVAAVRFQVSSDEGELVWTPWKETDGFDAFEVPAPEQATVLLQLRDKAGNEGPEKRLPPVPVRSQAAGPADAASWLQEALFDPVASPMTLAKGSPVVFSVVVQEWDGKEPDRAWIEIVGLQIPLVPRDPESVEGSRVYTGETSALPVTRFDDPHTYRVHAAWGDHVVSLGPLPGPLVVTTLQDEEDASNFSRSERGIPAPFLLPFLMLMGAAALFARTRAGQPRRDA